MRTYTLYVCLAASLSIFLIFGFVYAEHPGNPLPPGKSVLEHPGRSVEQPKGAEHPGKAITADSVKKSIQGHVKALLKGGVFTIRDEKLNREWQLTLTKIHDPVRSFEKDGTTIYFACSDFTSVNSKDILDIDFWMVPKGDKLEVVETKIHKVNGEPRYTFEGIELKEIK
jgi:hypothetical protein